MVTTSQCERSQRASVGVAMTSRALESLRHTLESEREANLTRRPKEQPAPSVAQLLALQRGVGNQTVARMVAQRRPVPSCDRPPRRLQRVVFEIPDKHLKAGTQEFTDDWNDVQRGGSGLRKRDGANQSPDTGNAPLAGLPNGEKIYLHGHGGPGHVGGHSATDLFGTLKALGLAPDYTGTILIAACQSGVRTQHGIGPSLAGALAGLLSGEGYQAKVEGLTGNLLIADQTGEMRVITDAKAYDAELAEWEERWQALKKRADGTHQGAERQFPEEFAKIKIDQRAIIERHSITYETPGSKVLLGASDDRRLLAGGLVVGLLAAAFGAFKYYNR